MHWRVCFCKLPDRHVIFYTQPKIDFVVSIVFEETWQEAEMPGEMDSAFLDDLKKVFSKMSRREIIISIGAAGQVIRNRSIIASAHYTELCLACL